MNLILTHKRFQEDGIFGELAAESGALLAVTLEHSYDNQPKLQPGTYICVRGMHRLHGMASDFETFEITGVVGHTNILFHWGNWNSDSEGCVLLGEKIQPSINHANSTLMITNSKVIFAMLMALQVGVNSFSLEVTQAL